MDNWRNRTGETDRKFFKQTKERSYGNWRTNNGENEEVVRGNEEKNEINWRSGDANERRFFKQSNEQTGAILKSRDVQIAGHQQNHSSRFAVRSANSNSRLQSIMANSRSSSSNWKSRSSRTHFQDLAKLERFLDGDPKEFISELLCESAWFTELVDTVPDLSFDCIVVIVQLFAKMSECLLAATNTSEVLKVASADLFLLQLKNLILVLPHQADKDRRGASYFWRDADDFFINLSKYCEMMLSLSPTNAYDILQNLMVAVEVTLPNLSVLSDETKNLFQILKGKLTVYQEEINFKYKKKDKKVDISELEPPDDFRWISLHPLPMEITNRQKAFVRPNVIDGPYRNVEHYLDVQFRLLREDFVKPLREGICDFMDGADKKLQNIRIYQNVKLVAPIVCPNNGTCGILVQIEIKDRDKYQLIIQHSRRFMYGSLVCFTTNNFNSVFFGKIIGRDPPLLSRGQLIIEFEGDGIVEYNVNCLMVESNVFFEPYYRVLKVLQHLKESTFPMKKYIVDVCTDMDQPSYPAIPNHCTDDYNLHSLFVSSQSYEDDDFRHEIWPDEIWLRNERRRTERELNEAQSRAFRAAENTSLCLIQGPPGTGKTHLGLTVAKKLLEIRSQWYHNCYPLLVVCFTNHALDQFLEGLLTTTNRLVRIGGQSKNPKLNRYNIRNHRQGCTEDTSKAFKAARSVMQEVHRNVERLDHDIKEAKLFFGVVDIVSLLETLPELLGTWFEVITQKELISWLLEGQTEFQMRQTFQARQAQQRSQYEELQNIPEDPNQQHDIVIDDVFSTDIAFSSSSTYIFSPDEILQKIYSLKIKKAKFEKHAEEHEEDIYVVNMEIASLENTLTYLEMRLAQIAVTTEFNQTGPIDFYNPLSIHPNDRWSLYLYWLDLYVEKKKDEIAKCQSEYQVYYETYERLRTVEDVRIMKNNLVIGMTTTSAARLREGLRELKSPIVIVEEAAEIMESHVVASLTEHCGHLILIGDHQQLRPSTADYTMEKKYKLGISLFERLIRNNIPCNVLNVQHRMRPEIAKLISPNIYPDLQNHKSVYDFPPVRGVQNSLYFITHANPEKKSMDETKSNSYEADFLLHLAKYLLLNGYGSEDITILAAYSGQMFLLERERKKHEILNDIRITVLDNYQGEESKIILLSLVRNNDEGKIGFLSIENRVCVALSRAKEGLYIMGNIDMLSANNDLWKRIRAVLEEQKSLGTSLPLQCENHTGKLTFITNISDFSKVRHGGCHVNCEQLLNCGHNCPLMCHRYDRNHKLIKCHERCTKVLCENEHVCPKLCHQECGECVVLVPRTLECGHEMMYKCSEKTLECQYPVTSELPCKHKIDNKPCYVDVNKYRCPFPCEGRLDECGHACSRKCHIIDDPDHLKVKCYKQCVKYSKNCSMDTEKHICPKLCFEDCPVCLVMIRKERSCAHFYEVDCSVDVETVICRRPCKKQLACGHACKLKCNQPCGNCKVKVNKVIPECGHQVSTLCSKEPTKIDCKSNCQLILPCGHKCNKRCSEKCTTQCTGPVDSITALLCGHHAKIPCYMNNAGCIKQGNVVMYCTELCSALLDCGHVCAGSCGLCYQGRIHQICGKPCGANLICGHKCTVSCSKPCPPCTVNMCSYMCTHRKCTNKCGNACKPCYNRCPRQCEHVKCYKKCGQRCSEPACEQPCKKKLSCGHQCIGFCGEPCPPLCMSCNREELLTFSMGHEEEEDAKFVLLQECKHVVESKGMEKWLETEVCVKRCPRCLIPLTMTRRYNEYIHDSKAQIQTVKSTFFGKASDLRYLQDLLFKRLELNYQNMSVFRRVSKTYENTYKLIQKDLKQDTKKQTISNVSSKILTLKIQILEDICELLNGLLSRSRTTKCVQYIDFLVRRLTLYENRMTEQEVNDYTIEMKRLRRMLQLDDVEQTYPSVTENDSYKSLRDRLYSYLRYDVNNDETNKEDLQKLVELVGGDTSMIKDIELQVLIQVVGVKDGLLHSRMS